jgi:serine/threonine protein phosphatase 1
MACRITRRWLGHGWQGDDRLCRRHNGKLSAYRLPDVLTAFRRLPANPVGRDFVVGDVHGCFDTLGLLLGQVDFDPTCDRLLSVGDLIDRGPRSWQVLDWLAQMWLFAVRGNHEQMAIDYDASDAWRERYARNGGQWFMALPPSQQERYRNVFAAMPLAIELPVGNRLVGLVHADCPEDDWVVFQARLASGEGVACSNGQTVLHEATWSRERIRGQARARVAGVDVLCVGHTPVSLARQRDNVLYVDTGAVYGRQLTLLCLQDMSVHSLACTESACADE